MGYTQPIKHLGTSGMHALASHWDEPTDHGDHGPRWMRTTIESAQNTRRRRRQTTTGSEKEDAMGTQRWRDWVTTVDLVEMTGGFSQAPNGMAGFFQSFFL